MGFKYMTCLTLSLALTFGWAGAVSLPTILPTKTDLAMSIGPNAWVDGSNLGEGYVTVAYTGDTDVKIKVLITKAGEETAYPAYDLSNSGEPQRFPLTQGDGLYTVGVYEQMSGQQYLPVHLCTLSVTLRHEFLPFLYPNQYVDYQPHDLIVQTATLMFQEESTDFRRVGRAFDYVVDFFTYDYTLADEVASGYLPDIDQSLLTRTGICLDYAAVLTAMLRSQGIPTKLVVGYAGDVYHAWVEVYLQETGQLAQGIYVDTPGWVRLDPTFTSSQARSDTIMDFVNEDENYTPLYYY